MPLQEKDKSVNQKFSDMRLGQDGRAMEDIAAMQYYEQFDSTDENSYPALKLEKNDTPLLHKNFYNSFIDFLEPFNHLKK